MPKLTLLPLSLAAVFGIASLPVQAKEQEPSAVGEFFRICGGDGQEAMKRLPGKTTKKSKAPDFFQRDLARSGENHRVTRMDDDFAMRAIMPGHVGSGAILIKCAIGTGRTSYDNALSELAQAAGKEPTEMGDRENGRRAMFLSADAPYQLFEEKNGWVSIYRMDIMISAQGIDPDYLKEGAELQPLPKAQ